MLRSGRVGILIAGLGRSAGAIVGSDRRGRSGVIVRTDGRGRSGVVVRADGRGRSGVIARSEGRGCSGVIVRTDGRGRSGAIVGSDHGTPVTPDLGLSDAEIPDGVRIEGNLAS